MSSEINWARVEDWVTGALSLISLALAIYAIVISEYLVASVIFLWILVLSYDLVT